MVMMIIIIIIIIISDLYCSGVVFVWFRLLIIKQHIAMMLPAYSYHPFPAPEQNLNRDIVADSTEDGLLSTGSVKVVPTTR